MGRLVDELLLLARLDNGQQLVQEPVELTQLALEAVDRARVVEPARQVSLTAERPVWIIGDEGRLRQALDNLLSNVRAHTPTPAQVRVTVHARGGMAVLEVADAGPGMSAEQRGARSSASTAGMHPDRATAVVPAWASRSSRQSWPRMADKLPLNLRTVVAHESVSSCRLPRQSPAGRVQASQVTRSWEPDDVCSGHHSRQGFRAEIGGFRAHEERAVENIGHLTRARRSPLPSARLDWRLLFTREPLPRGLTTDA
jgi:histidine kinase/DNA gyrase B/HSP90-like ATPase